MAGAGLAIDQVTKLLVMKLMELHQSIPLWRGVFHLTYVTNTGAAFSLFSQNPIGLKWISLLVSLGLVILGWRARNWHPWEKVGFGLILAGAAGNGIDRFLYGYVIDFLDLRLIRFPVFNVADVCINLGLACLLVYLWQHPR